MVAAYSPFAPQVRPCARCAAGSCCAGSIARPPQGPRHHQPRAATKAAPEITANLGVVFSLAWRAHPGRRRRHAQPAPAPAVRVENRAGLSAALSSRGTPDIISGFPPARSLGAAGRHHAAQPAGASRPPQLRATAATARRRIRRDPSTPRRQPVCRRADDGGARRQRTRNRAIIPAASVSCAATPTCCNRPAPASSSRAHQPAKPRASHQRHERLPPRHRHQPRPARPGSSCWPDCVHVCCELPPHWT